MIIERKQFGAVTLLFVQIGLALYVIVVFLAQGPNGTVNPKVLKIQKVGEAQNTQLRLENIAESSEQLENLNNVILSLSAPQIAPLNKPEVIISILPNTTIKTPNSPDIFNTGSKPRAPTLV